MITFEEKIKALEWLVFDVDGVFTDGRMYFDSKGEAMKAFHIQDGLGIALARKAGLKIAILTARTSGMVASRAAELKIDEIIQGSKNKGEAVEILSHRVNCPLSKMAFMGDDLVDLPAMTRVGVKATLSDGAEEVKQIADWVSTRPGGRGAIREWIEVILKIRGEWDSLVLEYMRL